MNHIDCPRSIRLQISTQQVGQELLVYDETRHKAFCLNATSAAIWQMCDGVRTVQEVTSAVTLQLAAPVTEEIVLFALGELRADGLLEPDTLSPSVPTPSRRQLMQKLGVGAAMLLPGIAAVMAPTAAQAYSGCVDCSANSSRRAQRKAPVEPANGPN